MTTAPDITIRDLPPADDPAPWTRPGLFASGLVALGVALAYWPNLFELVQTWWEQPNYSHGFLVIPISAAILWQRRDDLKNVAIRPNVLGWVALGLILMARSFFYERNLGWYESATIPLSVASLVLALGGWQMLRWAFPGVAFLYLMLPLPVSVNIALTSPLQALATVASSIMLTITGLHVVTTGNVIWVGAQPLEVARACNGLSIMMSFVTLVTATVILARDLPLWQRIVLFLSTVPIALTANIIRITATAWCYYLFGHEFGDKIAHDTAGWMMMPLALLLIWLEMKILGWLVIEETIDPKASVRMHFQTAGPRIVKK